MEQHESGGLPVGAGGVRLTVNPSDDAFDTLTQQFSCYTSRIKPSYIYTCPEMFVFNFKSTSCFHCSVLTITPVHNLTWETGPVMYLMLLGYARPRWPELQSGIGHTVWEVCYQTPGRSQPLPDVGSVSDLSGAKGLDCC